MSQNSEEEENHLRLRRIREFIDSHQQPKEELIQDNQKEQGEMAAANNRTLKELATPDLDQQPLCIQYPNLEVAFELKSGLIHLLPTFHGFAGEDPNKHLKEFHVVCSSMRPTGVTEEQIKLRAFPFSLADSAKEWLYYLPSGTITTWNGMKKAFLERYFPASKAANIRKEICGIRQYNGETLYEYWERFKKLCASCPHHQISEQLLIQYFYEGLLPMERSMIDAASGGALVDKTPEDARLLISNMAANSQQFSMRHDPPPQPKKVNEVSIASLEQKFDKLTSLVQQLAVGNMHQIKACGICSNMGHQTDMCPTLQEDTNEHAHAMGGYQNQQRKYDPYSNTYNPGWRDHPNFSYGNQTQVAPPPFDNRPQGFQQRVQQPYQARQQVPPTQNSGTSLEDLVKALSTNTIQFQQETKASIRNLEAQMGQMASTISQLQSRDSGKLPSQTIVNPRENANAITLRSGKQLETPQKDNAQRKENTIASSSHPNEPKEKVTSKPFFPSYITPPPFPSRLEKSKKEEQQKEILDTFRKVG